MASIRLDHVTKIYAGDTPAVNDVTLDVDDGEFMILVGPSGCGKSTILRMIVGLEDVTSGDDLHRRPAGERPATARPQPGHGLPELRPVPPPHGLREHRLPAAPAQGARRRGAPSGSRRPPGCSSWRSSSTASRRQLSGGQRQRVAMGRAIVRRADAFLFDEPLSNLDAKLRGQMRTEISRLQSRLGITTVYVTHDQIEAMTLGDRVAVLRKGVLQQVDAPRELYEQPVNLFVAGFIGSPPMNFMPGRRRGRHAAPTHRRRQADAAKWRASVQGRDILIAGVRPEHFEDAAMLDDARKAEGLTVQGPRRRDRVAGQRAVCLHPLRGARRGAPHAPGAGHRARQRADAHPAGGRPRCREPGDRGVGTPTLWLDPSRMHLFDPASGENLTRGHGAEARILVSA